MSVCVCVRVQIPAPVPFSEFEWFCMWIFVDICGLQMIDDDWHKKSCSMWLSRGFRHPADPRAYGLPGLLRHRQCCLDDKAALTADSRVCWNPGNAAPTIHTLLRDLTYPDMINVKALHRLHPIPCCCVFIFVFPSSSLLCTMKLWRVWHSERCVQEQLNPLDIYHWCADEDTIQLPVETSAQLTQLSKDPKGSKRIQKDPKGSKRIQKIIKAKHSCHTRWLRAICKTYIDLSIQILGFSVKGQQNPVQPRSRSLELISVLPSLAVLVELVDRCTWGPYSCRMCRSIKYIWLSHSDIKRQSS